MIANSISEINPYFRAFNIKIEKRFNKINKQLIVERCETPLYREVKRQTEFAMLTMGTGYDKYAIDNEYLEDNTEFIEEKTNKAKNRFNLKYRNIYIGIWFDTIEGKIYASSKYNKQLPTYAILSSDLKPNYLILKASSNYLKILRNAFLYGYIYYEDMKIKGYMIEVQKYLNIK